MSNMMEIAQKAVSNIQIGSNWDWLDVAGFEWSHEDPRSNEPTFSPDGKRLLLLTFFTSTDSAMPYCVEVTISTVKPDDFEAADFHIDDYDWTVDSARVIDKA